MNRYSINICDDASHNLSIEQANRMRECDENQIDSVSIKLINAHIKTLCETGRESLLTLREYVVEKYTDEYHLLFVLRDDSDDDAQDTDDFDVSFVASFQII